MSLTRQPHGAGGTSQLENQINESRSIMSMYPALLFLSPVYTDTHVTFHVQIKYYSSNEENNIQRQNFSSYEFAKTF